MKRLAAPTSSWLLFLMGQALHFAEGVHAVQVIECPPASRLKLALQRLHPFVSRRSRRCLRLEPSSEKGSERTTAPQQLLLHRGDLKRSLVERR
jgi:hypothetical protein